MGVLPGHVADNLQRSGASSRPDEGLKTFLLINISRSLKVFTCCEFVVSFLFNGP